MTEAFSFDIVFEKFDIHKTIKFPKGLSVVYGESGSGKSELIYSLLNKQVKASRNFLVAHKENQESFQLVFQNPENQIICPDIDSELSFGLECNSKFKDNAEINTELQRMKSELSFIDNWSRHPNTLSGGEMEMLNLVTAFNSHSDIVLIDDGLSYLNEKTKKKWLDLIVLNSKNDKIIIWFTSDLNDLNYSQSKWVLSLSDLKPYESKNFSQFYEHSHKKGFLSIKAKELCFSFDNAHKILIKNLNFNISNTRSLGIVGGNGSGKTTFSNIMLKAIRPDSGLIDIEIAGSKPRIGTLNQFPERALGTDTLFELLNKLIENKVFDINLTNSCVKKLNSHQISWEGIKNKHVSELPWSVVRLCLIIILSLGSYDLIILDEPTFGLGHKQKKRLSELIQGILVNKHLILISHDLEFINAHCDQILDFDTKKITNNKKILNNAK